MPLGTRFPALYGGCPDELPVRPRPGTPHSTRVGIAAQLPSSVSDRGSVRRSDSVAVTAGVPCGRDTTLPGHDGGMRAASVTAATVIVPAFPTIDRNRSWNTSTRYPPAASSRWTSSDLWRGAIRHAEQVTFAVPRNAVRTLICLRPSAHTGHRRDRGGLSARSLPGLTERRRFLDSPGVPAY